MEKDAQKIVSSSKKLLFKLNSTTLYSTDLDSVEPLSQETFSDLIQTFISSKKQSIIAVVKSRDSEQLDQYFSFFFNAYQLNKLLFKLKNSRDLISRHDRQHPFSVINPLTNTLIIGEVEYFIVNPSKDIEKTSEDDFLEATLIGTDLTYVTSEKLREVFKSNALRPEDLIFPTFQGLFEGFLPGPPNLEEIQRDFEENRDVLLAQVRVPFKKAAFFGVVFVFFNAILGIVLVMAGKKFVAASYGKINRFSPSEVCQICCLTCACFFFDRYVKKLFKENEERAVLHGKIISWVCLGGAIGLTYTTDSVVIMMSCTGMLAGFTVFYHTFAFIMFLVFHSKKRLV
jgi:hypothetical protein